MDLREGEQVGTGGTVALTLRWAQAPMVKAELVDTSPSRRQGTLSPRPS